MLAHHHLAAVEADEPGARADVVRGGVVHLARGRDHPVRAVHARDAVEVQAAVHALRLAGELQGGLVAVHPGAVVGVQVDVVLVDHREVVVIQIVDVREQILVDLHLERGSDDQAESLLLGLDDDGEQLRSADDDVAVAAEVDELAHSELGSALEGKIDRVHLERLSVAVGLEDGSASVEHNEDVRVVDASGLHVLHFVLNLGIRGITVERETGARPHVSLLIERNRHAHLDGGVVGEVWELVGVDLRHDR